MGTDPNFPYTKQFVSVLGSHIAYVDEGEGAPIVFLHGNPTSSYLWRGVIPHAAEVGRAIAIDLIGMGDSDKPDISYRIYDQCDHFVAFIDVLGLENVHLVANDWGTAVASQYVTTHRENVKSITFVANIITPWPTWEMFGGKSAALSASGLPALLLYYPELKPAVDPYSALLPGLTAVEIPNSGHYMPEDQPDRVGEEVAKWIRNQS